MDSLDWTPPWHQAQRRDCRWDENRSLLLNRERQPANPLCGPPSPRRPAEADRAARKSAFR